MPRATMRYWAAAKEAAGAAEESYEAANLAEALAAVRERHVSNTRLSGVLERSSFVINEAPVGTRPHAGVLLAEGDVIEVLPPFAGG